MLMRRKADVENRVSEMIVFSLSVKPQERKGGIEEEREEIHASTLKRKGYENIREELRSRELSSLTF